MGSELSHCCDKEQRKDDPDPQLNSNILVSLVKAEMVDKVAT